jgi:hypothetical protein
MDRRAIWKELTQLGPFRWNNVAPLRAARVALASISRASTWCLRYLLISSRTQLKR